MDLNILRAMAQRKSFTYLYEYVPKDMLSIDSVAILEWYKFYFNSYKDIEEIDFSLFREFLKLKMAKLGREKVDAVLHILKKVEAIPLSTVTSITNSLIDLAYSGEVARITERYQDGDEVDYKAEMDLINAKYNQFYIASETLFEYDSNDVDYVMDNTEESGGIHFNFLPMLRDNLRGLRGGDNVGFAASVDSGKTSCLCEMAIDFAQQLTTLGDDRPIWWFVNEGTALSINARLYQCLAHTNKDETYALYKQGKLKDMYKTICGSLDRIRVKNAHSLRIDELAKIVEKTKPAIVITDMVDKLKGISCDKSHESVERKWITLRELACEHDFINVGTIQLSVEGYEKRYPLLTELKDSKVGIQGTLDLGLFMGRVMSENESRYFSTPKNKIRKSGSPSYLRFETKFDSDRCKFESVEYL